ncbi:MAG TPA: class F sortase [Kineosporiaceae bacterium]|nr:class F sortase [Kineosporiaceae bacterium]
MRDPITTPWYVRVASCLVVAGIGLSIGALGTSGLLNLLVGADGDAGVAVAADDAVPGLTGIVGGPKVLQDDQVIVPSEVPDGTALTGRAPIARVAQELGEVAFIPTSIRLPSGRLAPIQPASVHPDGVLDVPQNPDRIGWWTGGAQAGEPFGGIVLAGHVDSAGYGIGVLAEMINMRPGQNLKLADGTHGQIYRVATVRKLSKARLAAGTDLFDQRGKHRLVMITCGGPFDPETHRYRDNVVIVANPLR